MATLGSVLLLFTAFLGDRPPKPETLRYLRPSGDKFVLESEIATTATTYTSLTERGTQKMTLNLTFGKDKTITEAEAILQTNESRQRAFLKLDGTKARLTRDSKVEEFETAADPVVTTAPDWSDIFLLVRRYDIDKAGKQEFAGLWIHPVKETLKLTFMIERIGQETIVVKDKRVKLARYRIHLRSGDYVAWADSSRTVVKLMPANAKAGLVVLEGYEQSTDGLVP